MTRSAQNSESRAEESNADVMSPDRPSMAGASGQKLSPDKLEKIKAAFQKKGKNSSNNSNKLLKF